jgi:hypothetical protein
MKNKATKIVSRTAVIKDLQHVLKVFPDSQPDRDFYRVHGRYSDAEWKAHFPRFKDFAKAAITVKPFEEARRALNRAFTIIKKRSGVLSAQEIDILSDKVTELYDEFWTWRFIKHMDKEEEQAAAEEIPTVGRLTRSF